MTLISDLPWDVVEEILSRVSLTSLRAVGSTCKRWNVLSKDKSFTKKHCGKSAKEFVVNMSCENSLSTTTRFNLHNINDLSEEIGGILCPVKISEEVYQCNGLFLLVTKDSSRLIVWNPYLGQTKWIEPKKKFHELDWYALGYDNKNNHKVLRFFYDCGNNVKIEIYDFKSNSWRVLNIPTHSYLLFQRGVSLKGNTYFVYNEDSLIFFDFTKERFGALLDMPFDYDGEDIILSCVREDQLAVLLGCCSNTIYKMEIWITTKIEPETVSWSKFFKVGSQVVHRLNFLSNRFGPHSFFIDKEKKVAVVCGRDYSKSKGREETSFMVGEDGSFQEMDLIRDVFSYVPSSVQLIQ